jgi:hypothetical protein
MIQRTQSKDNGQRFIQKVAVFMMLTLIIPGCIGNEEPPEPNPCEVTESGEKLGPIKARIEATPVDIFGA